jgi:hypothetical protein
MNFLPLHARQPRAVGGSGTCPPGQVPEVLRSATSHPVPLRSLFDRDSTAQAMELVLVAHRAHDSRIVALQDSIDAIKLHRTEATVSHDELSGYPAAAASAPGQAAPLIGGLSPERDSGSCCGHVAIVTERPSQ